MVFDRYGSHLSQAVRSKRGSVIWSAQTSLNGMPASCRCPSSFTDRKLRWPDDEAATRLIAVYRASKN
ncbi:uncharacterized protein METZ01_LOCUS99318, partial [marine metagenome]